MPGSIVTGGGSSFWQAYKGTLFIFSRIGAIERLIGERTMVRKDTKVTSSEEQAQEWLEKSQEGAVQQVDNIEFGSKQEKALHKLSETIESVTAHHPQNHQYLGSDRDPNRSSKESDSSDVREYCLTNKGNNVQTNVEVKFQMFSRAEYRDATSFENRVIKGDGKGSFYKNTGRGENKTSSDNLYKGSSKPVGKKPTKIDEIDRKLVFQTSSEKNIQNIMKDRTGVDSILKKGNADHAEFNKVTLGHPWKPFDARQLPENRGIMKDFPKKPSGFDNDV